MKITAAGVPVGGVAGAGVFVGATRIRPEGVGTATAGGDRVYYQGPDALVHSCALDGSGDRMEPCPAKIGLIVASSSAWAAWHEGGTTTSWGQFFTDAVPLAATDDGAILLLTSYSTGSGLRMVTADGVIFDRPNAHPVVYYPHPQAFALDRGRVIYWDTQLGALVSIGLPTPKHSPGAVDPFLVEAPNGTVWLGYHTDRLVLHPIDDASKGYVLDTSLTYGTTATGRLVGFSRDMGESQMVVVPIDWTADLVSLVPVESPVPNALAPNVPSVAFAGFWRADAAAPGNAAIDSLSHPAVIAGEESILSVPKECRLGLLVYVAGSDTEAITAVQRGVAFATEHDLVIFLYDDQRRFRYPLFRDLIAGMRVVLMPQWYSRANQALLDAGESPTQFAADVIAQAKTFDGHYLMPTIRATFGGWTIPAADVVEALNELVRQGALNLPGFIGWLFWAWNRKDGVNANALVDDSGKPFPVPAFRPAIDLWMQTPTTASNAAAWIADAFSHEIEVPPVSDVPDYSADVRALFNTGAFKLDSHDGCGIFTDAAARLIHAKDDEIGHLLKPEGRNQYPDWKPGEPGHAVDAVLHKSAGCSIDIITKSETPEAGPGWGVDIPRYSVSDWRDPGPQPSSSVQRPALPFVLGMTAFDWCTHRDPAWLDLHVEYKLPYLRLIPQSVFRTKRSLAEGLAQLDAALPLIAAKGLGALISLNCDTKEYGMSRADVVANTIAMNAIAVKHLPLFKPGYLILDEGNEVQNGNEQPFMMDPFFLKELDALIDPRFPLGWAPMFGSDVALASVGGSWVPFHPDRGLTADQNGAIMAAAQQKHGKKVMNREDIGFAEPGTPGQRTWDIERARAIGANAKRHKLGGLIYHTQAGLRANVAEFGEYHRKGAVALVEGLGGAVIVPPPPPVEVDAFVTLRNEAIASAITIAYDTLLNRKPDPDGWNIYQGRLRSGWTVPMMEEDMRNSPEYKALHGG